MVFTMDDVPLSLYLRHLGVLSHLLKRGEEFAKEKGIDANDIPEWRLIDDMKPLAFQIQSSCSTVARTLDFFKLEKSKEPNDEKTLADLQQRLSRTIELLEKVDRQFVERNAESPVHIPVGPSGLDLTAQKAVLKMAIPNFYFHVSMAYSILRAKGVPVGKDDWLTGGQPWSQMMD
jgi:hypothetical protein